MFLVGCSKPEHCAKYASEVYMNEQVDTTLLREATEYRDTLLKRFKETSVKRLHHTAYHMMYYSSHGFGASIKFEKNESSCYLKVKCLSTNDWKPECDRSYEMQITEEEWMEFEAMIDEFDFWTAKQLNEKREVLDSYAFIIEGVRPDAGICGKRTYRLLGRSSPRFDKIGDLCEHIIDYERTLAPYPK